MPIKLKHNISAPTPFKIELVKIGNPSLGKLTIHPNLYYEDSYYKFISAHATSSNVFKLLGGFDNAQLIFSEGNFGIFRAIDITKSKVGNNHVIGLLKEKQYFNSEIKHLPSFVFYNREIAVPLPRTEVEVYQFNSFQEKVFEASNKKNKFRVELGLNKIESLLLVDVERNAIASKAYEELSQTILKKAMSLKEEVKVIGPRDIGVEEID